VDTVTSRISFAFPNSLPHHLPQSFKTRKPSLTFQRYVHFFVDNVDVPANTHFPWPQLHSRIIRARAHPLPPPPSRLHSPILLLHLHNGIRTTSKVPVDYNYPLCPSPAPYVIHPSVNLISPSSWRSSASTGASKKEPEQQCSLVAWLEVNIK
jgi:hypothetical protein